MIEFLEEYLSFLNHRQSENLLQGLEDLGNQGEFSHCGKFQQHHLLWQAEELSSAQNY